MTDSLILIVDDNFKNLQVLGSTLREEKFKTAIATNGFEALDFVEEKLPDLILLDIMMPQMDGIEVCKRLKSNKRTQEIPIIFLTAKTDTNTIKEAFKVGGQDYITKPFKSVELLSRVKTHLEINSNRAILKNMNLLLEEKVAERTKELTLANQKLNKMDTAKSNFLNLISHELRTPLNAIKGFSYILKDVVLDEKYLDFLDEIDQAADKLVRISDVSLLITTLQFENFKKRKTSTNISLFLDGVIHAYCSNNKIDKQKIILTTKADTELVTIETTLISNALSMILDNAIKHSPEEGKVFIKASIENSTATIKIEDEGPGLTEKAKEQLFTFFSDKTLFSASGLGVGLATVKLIMNAVSGNIKVASRDKNGTEVTISFPT